MCLFQIRSKERHWECRGFEDSASHMISEHVLMAVPGGLLLNMALAVPHMKMCTALSPTAWSRDSHSFRLNSFITKCCMVKAETFHAWWLRFDGLLPRQGRTSCRVSRNTVQSAAKDLPARQKLCLCQRQTKSKFQNSIASYHLENTFFQLFSAVTHFKASCPAAVTTN